jgi:hypothetical protein
MCFCQSYFNPPVLFDGRELSAFPSDAVQVKPAADGSWMETLAVDGRPLDLPSTSKVLEAMAGCHLEIAGWMADSDHPAISVLSTK